VTPRFANDVCRDGKSLLDHDTRGQPSDCDIKGERAPLQPRIMHPAVSAAMIDLLKGPLVIGPTGTAAALRTGVIPGMDPLGDGIWKLKPEERKKRTLAFPVEEAGELAGKTGTATNADGKTSDVWLLLFIPGPSGNPKKGIVLGFWMGKDSKDHALGTRGSTGGPGFAESGARNWLPSAATVLAFLRKERGLLRPGNKFEPIFRDGLSEAPRAVAAPQPSNNALAIAAAPGIANASELVSDRPPHAAGVAASYRE
jgi:membrane peptidoglycan carboxypeptidase